MDVNLILSAQTLCLAPQLKRSGLINGLYVLKNVPAKTYLRVSPEQWVILQQFVVPRTVPAVLGSAIRNRQCLRLGEFFELILKALRAGILLEPGIGPEPVRAFEWRWEVRPKMLGTPLAALFGIGTVAALVCHPKLPTTFLDWVCGLLLLSAALSCGSFIAGCLIRGAGGEVYRPRWQWLSLPPRFALDTNDAIILPIKSQAIIGLAGPAVLAIAAGLSAWRRPGWELFSLLALIISMRPIFGGRFSSLIHVGIKRGLSDAEQSYMFPPNRRPETRGWLLNRALRQPTTWVRMGYGILWAIAILSWGDRLMDMPPWTFAFWVGFLKNYGVQVLLWIGGSLIALGAAYLFWETYHSVKERAQARRNTLRLWRERWFGQGKIILDESSRMKAMAASPLLSTLQPPQRLELARAMGVRRYGPWKTLWEYENLPTQVALIVSGKVALRRELATGRSVQAQVLTEGDIIGLHDLADPKFPNYLLRSLTPLTLLAMDRAMAEELVVRKVPQATITDMLLKMPFLRRISLCQNWHLQAINRFARLSTIVGYPPGSVILSEGQTVEDFFIIFQGNARVTQKTRQLAVIRSGEFFGEIGLMQNSSPNATVTAYQGTRCLSIPRIELLRFVTHNYTVALEIERVSSERLGRPLFPLDQGDFSIT
jgi:CRP-like cAMP-binding protein